MAGDEVGNMRDSVFPEELVMDLVGASGHDVPDAADDFIEY